MPPVSIFDMAARTADDPDVGGDPPTDEFALKGVAKLVSDSAALLNRDLYLAQAQNTAMTAILDPNTPDGEAILAELNGLVFDLRQALGFTPTI